MQHLGFKALASTSAGFAWTIGKADNRVTVDDVCDHLTAICAAVDIPVNADFEDGFAHEPDKVGANVARAVKTGVAGLSIEDFTGDNAKPLFDRALGDRSHQGGAQGDRCRQQRRAAHRPLRGVPARAEGSEARDRPAAPPMPKPAPTASMRPASRRQEEISAVVKAVHPKPVNLLVGAAGPSLQAAADLGVRRISVGGALARMAWAGFMKAAKEMAEQGTFTELANGYPGGELNKMFS